MFKLIKNAHVYTPKDIGVVDLLIANDRIVKVEKDIEFNYEGLEIIEAKGKVITPGIVDQHIHITGGGGEGSFKTRVPDVMIGELIESGITSVVGLLGTDTTTRSVANLLARAKSLREEGMNAYCLTGGYDYPSPNLTGSIKKDITFISEILGVKLAISDHRAPLITQAEFQKLVSDVRTAGMFSGKSAYVKLHMGSGKERFSVINRILDETDLSITHFRPTHVGRDLKLFEEALDFAKKGGIIDFTACDSSNAITLIEIFKTIKQNNVPLENITISSDGRGSWSTYDSKGRLERIGHASCNTMHKTMKRLIESETLTSEEAISICTSNVSKAIGLKDRGEIAEGNFADLLFLDKNYNINSVIINGKWGLKDKQLKIKGTYES